MKDNLTQLLFAFDSGSVPAGHYEDSIKEMKTLFSELKKTGKELRVSAVRFTESEETRIVNQPLEKIKAADFGLKSDETGACPMLDKTATLMDDIGARLTNTPQEEIPSQIILTIIVFGRDNASKHTTYDKLKYMIALQRDIYKWRIFLVTDFTRNMELLSISEDDTFVIKKDEKSWFKRPFAELTEKMVQHINEFKQ